MGTWSSLGGGWCHIPGRVVVNQELSPRLHHRPLPGLDIDGLYRVSGNLATIQKLRYKVEHGKVTRGDEGQMEYNPPPRAG